MHSRECDTQPSSHHAGSVRMDSQHRAIVLVATNVQHDVEEPVDETQLAIVCLQDAIDFLRTGLLRTKKSHRRTKFEPDAKEK